MDAIIIANPGLEDASSTEITEKLPRLAAKRQVRDGTVLLQAVESSQDVQELCNVLHTANRVLLSQGTMDDPSFSINLISGRSVAVRTLGFENRAVSSAECAKEICATLDKRGCRYTVDLTRPDLLVYCIKGAKHSYLGIDCSGDLTKRDYLVFIHNQMLRPTIAAGMVQLSGFRGKGTLLDPFCGGGTIPIEAALDSLGLLHQHDRHAFPYLNVFADAAPHEFSAKDDPKDKMRIIGYDQSLHTITAARKNAKIAGVNKAIEHSAVDARMLDIKFDEKSVKHIVTQLPLLSSSSDRKKMLKLWDEFLFIAQDILDGRMVAAVNTDAPFEELLTKHAFELVEKRIAHQGKSRHFIYVLEAKKS